MSCYLGSCHCGAVRFRIAYRPDELTTCDCSYCSKIRNWSATAKDFELLQGEDVLADYGKDWGEGNIHHRFCSRCGIYVFHRKRAAPDHYGVNARCLEGLDLASLPLRATEGANMTITDPEARQAWPGPCVRG